MKLSELLEKADIKSCFEETEITDIVTDSKKAVNGCMFICLKGLKADGHKHIKEAMELGASTIVVENSICADIPAICPYVNIIGVDNTRSAQAMLYSAWYGNPSEKLKIIAVTGTNGKTSTTYMLKAIFEAAMYKCGIIGTISCASGGKSVFANPDDPLANMTTPDPKQLYELLAFMAADGIEFVFIEASSHALKLCKLDAIEFDGAIFTNLSEEHLDFHENMEDYANSKAKLFAKSKISLLNCSDTAYELMRKNSKGITYSFSSKNENADFYAENIENRGSKGIYYTLKSKYNIMKISCNIPGSFTVDNTLCAASCALIFGISPKTIYSALSSIKGIEGRMERLKICDKTDFSVFIDYAHTPDALENLLRSVKSFKDKKERIVLLFGCGGDRDTSKRDKMGKIAEEFADFIILTSDNSRSESPLKIIDDIKKGFSKENYKIIENRRNAIEYVIKNARAGDIILLAGKGHEKYEIDAKGKHEFDEKKIATDFIIEYHFNK